MYTELRLYMAQWVLLVALGNRYFETSMNLAINVCVTSRFICGW